MDIEQAKVRDYLRLKGWDLLLLNFFKGFVNWAIVNFHTNWSTNESKQYANLVRDIINIMFLLDADLENISAWNFKLVIYH